MATGRIDPFQCFVGLLPLDVFEKTPDAGAQTCLSLIKAQTQVQAHRLLPESSSAYLHNLASIVRAGGNDPSAQRIANLVVRSKFIHDTSSAEDTATFCAAAAALPRPPAGERAQVEPAAVPQAAPELVGNVKAEMRDDNISAAPSVRSLISGPSTFLGAPLGLSVVMGAAAAISLLLGGPVGAALGATLGVLAALGVALTLVGLAVLAVAAMLRRRTINNTLASAQSSENIAKIFHRLSPEAQAFLLDRLGTDFRKEVVKKNPNDSFVREFAGLFDVLESPEPTTPALKHETYEKVIAKWRLDVNRFGAFADRAQTKALQSSVLQPPRRL